MASELRSGFIHDLEPINPIRTRAEKISKFVWENLSEEERRIGGKDVEAQLLGFVLDIKPAVFLGKIDEPITNSKLIVDFLVENGVDALVYGPFLINNKLLLERINSEFDFAQELGLEQGMSLDDFLSKTSPYERNVLGEARTGFILGFPQSAIRAFSDHLMATNGKPALNSEQLVSIDIEHPAGGRVFYFSTSKSAEHAPDVENLKQRVNQTFNDVGYAKK